MPRQIDTRVPPANRPVSASPPIPPPTHRGTRTWDFVHAVGTRASTSLLQRFPHAIFRVFRGPRTRPAPEEHTSAPARSNARVRALGQVSVSRRGYSERRGEDLSDPLDFLSRKRAARLGEGFRVVKLALAFVMNSGQVRGTNTPYFCPCSVWQLSRSPML